MKHFFITGTDTGVGKTYFTRWLVQAWRTQGDEAVGLKPLATGDRMDAELLFQAGGGKLALSEINPYFFVVAAAPLVSARAEGRVIDPKELVERMGGQVRKFQKARFHVAVEGAGGWRVPISPGYEMRDLARDLGLPVIVVAMNRLGMLNHSLLTVESILAQGLTCAGVIVNDGPYDARRPVQEQLALESNAMTLRDFLPDMLPVFQLNRAAEIAGKIPLWLGGK